MTVVFATLLVVGVAAWIAAPLLRSGSNAPTGTSWEERAEALSHEKHIALVAIKEADLDRAMGKLSEEDYGVLRGIYEDRALGAMAELDAFVAQAPDGASHDDGFEQAPAAAHCGACGARFADRHRFCAGCGARRSSGPA